MADKGKGKDAGSVKKPKTEKLGNRPHEVRRREGLTKAAPDTAR